MAFNRFHALLIMSTTFCYACGGKLNETPSVPRINEVVSSNDGVSIDDTGQPEDWLELINASDTTINLKEFAIADSARQFHPLPNIELMPGQTLQLWADDETDQGVDHLPFKLSADGDSLFIRQNSTGDIVEQVEIPPMRTDYAYARFPSGSGAFSICRYTSAGTPNGEACEPAPPPTIEDVTFVGFDDSQWPNLKPSTLAINELSIAPAEFIELKNFSESEIHLADFRLILSNYPPTSGLPPFDHPSAIDLPDIQLTAGELWSQAVTNEHMEQIYVQEYGEGVAVLYHRESQQVVDVVPFMHWPENAALARINHSPFRFRFCHNTTRDQSNQCEQVNQRPLGNRARGLYTPNDFATLASGGGQTDSQSIKFLIDLQNDNAIHYAGVRRWPLHYTFVREILELQPPLNRCDEYENQLFNQGWATFSFENYSNTVTRRFHLGTLSEYPNADLRNVEFTFGDRITAQQMRDTFYMVTSLTAAPQTWSLRPQDASQIARAQEIEGTLPIVGPNAPFSNLVYQGLAKGVAYGTLTYIPTEELASRSLGRRTIVVTDDVPNDIDFVAGLITEAFQTPLAHVNILSQGRGTPNMALPGARSNADISPLLGELVRLEVTEGGYQIRSASLSEAEEHWAQQDQVRQPLVPRLEPNTQQLVTLQEATIDDLPTIGAKAAQLAELFQLDVSANSNCSESIQLSIPEGAFAIPMYYYIEHMNESGAQLYLNSLLEDDFFLSDLTYRKIALETLRQMIVQHPVNPALLAEVERAVYQRYGNQRVRFRSSSNTEDLEDFNGAGLYTSMGAELDDDEDTPEKAILTVWASLWNFRAFEERHYAQVDQTSVAMGILVHRAFTNERANGVAVARNILSPTRVDQYYFNSQAGEASVANPAPGIQTEQVIYQWPPRTPRLTYHSYSSLTDDNTPVITGAEARALACSMSAIQNHFKNLLDPNDQNRWFTMESEFKFLGEERTLLIKQARPYQFTPPDLPADCRENI